MQLHGKEKIGFNRIHIFFLCESHTESHCLKQHDGDSTMRRFLGELSLIAKEVKTYQFKEFKIKLLFLRQCQFIISINYRKCDMNQSAGAK